MGRIVLTVGVWLALSLGGREASADMMCGGPKRPLPPPDPAPPASASPRTRPVGAADSSTGRAPVEPAELGMVAGMVLLGGGAAASSRGRGRGKSFR